MNDHIDITNLGMIKSGIEFQKYDIAFFLAFAYNKYTENVAAY